MNQGYKSIFCLLVLSLSACESAFQPPRDTIVLWERDNTSVDEKAEIMKKCGYPSTQGAGSIKDKNEIAIIQLCMEENNFKYKGRLGTFCDSYPSLPACVEARREDK